MLRQALHTVFRNWALTLLIVASLGLAIGGNVAVFSGVKAQLLNPLPFDDIERLVFVRQGKSRGDRSLSLPNFSDVSERAAQFEGLAAFQWRERGARS